VRGIVHQVDCECAVHATSSRSRSVIGDSPGRFSVSWRSVRPRLDSGDLFGQQQQISQRPSEIDVDLVPHYASCSAEAEGRPNSPYAGVLLPPSRNDSGIGRTPAAA
jgi:hypothetical protein